MVKKFFAFLCLFCVVNTQVLFSQEKKIEVNTDFLQKFLKSCGNNKVKLDSKKLLLYKDPSNLKIGGVAALGLCGLLIGYFSNLSKEKDGFLSKKTKNLLWKGTFGGLGAFGLSYALYLLSFKFHKKLILTFDNDGLLCVGGEKIKWGDIKYIRRNTFTDGSELSLFCLDNVVLEQIILKDECGNVLLDLHSGFDLPVAIDNVEALIDYYMGLNDITIEPSLR